MKWKGLLLAAGIGLTGLGAWWGYSYLKPTEATQAAASPVVTVQKGVLEVHVSGTGSIEPAAREIVKFSDNRTIAQVHVAEKEEVKAGDVLITLEAEDVSDKLRVQELNMEKKQLELDELQKKWDEAADEDVRESLTVSIRKQELDMELNQLEIDALVEAQVAEVIKAPADGRVQGIEVKAGDVINQSVNLLEIVDYSHLQMKVNVDELDIAKVKLGQAAEVLVEALPQQSYTGEVTQIAEEGNSTGGVAHFEVTILLKDHTGLKSGMSAEATIQVEQKADVLYLPITAVQSSQNQYYVRVPQNEPASGSTDDEEDTANPAQDTPGSEEVQAARAERMRVAGAEGGGSGMGTGAGGGMRSLTGKQPGSGGMTAAAGQGMQVMVEVGVHNEDFIEIISGLNEGDLVQLPVTASSSAATPMNAGMGGLFPGAGGGGGAGLGGQRARPDGMGGGN
ncbi:efflux transporter [Paenibacillus algicola]|uniref:Efflux transporter n=1 Tax=Paenibacillus algicola TaxID=2565926 RepID=A0A4P8XPG3_9BACL|nr:efflux RND transporter periplasmic adaptor subunit [Paenibacillus algicola]QCT03541.1 efflux transporter [Paenibacillus algicola]